MLFACYAAAAAVYPGRWCPEEGANWLSQLFFAYANSLVRLGGRKHLEQADLWDTAHRQAKSYADHWLMLYSVWCIVA
jgi:hypothetical protein